MSGCRNTTEEEWQICLAVEIWRRRNVNAWLYEYGKEGMENMLG